MPLTLDKNMPELHPAAPAAENAVYSIAYLGDYVEIRHHKPFELTAEIAKAIWEEALRLCKAHRCASILRIGPPPDRRVTPEDAHRLGDALDIPGLHIAYCWDDYRPDRMAAAFATAALRNGAHVRYFCGSDMAVAWLNEGRNAA